MKGEKLIFNVVVLYKVTQNGNSELQVSETYWWSYTIYLFIYYCMFIYSLLFNCWLYFAIPFATVIWKITPLGD